MGILLYLLNNEHHTCTYVGGESKQFCLFCLESTLTKEFLSCDCSDYVTMSFQVIGISSQFVISFFLIFALIVQSILWCRGVRDRALIIVCSPIVSFDLLTQYTYACIVLYVQLYHWDRISGPVEASLSHLFSSVSPDLADFGMWLLCIVVIF